MTPLVEASYPYGATVKGVMLRMTWLPCGFKSPRTGMLDALVMSNGPVLLGSLLYFVPPTYEISLSLVN
jgi:hypothetical protein